MIKSIEKVGSVIIITLAEEENPIKYNCKDEVLISFTGKEVEDMPKILVDEKKKLSMGERFLIEALQLKMHGEPNLFKRMEQYVQVLELIQCSWNYLPYPCPKGFIEYVRKEGKINRNSYLKFTQEEKLKRLSQEERDFLAELRKVYNEADNNYQRALNMSKEERLILMKIFKITVKKIVWNLRNDFNQFIQNIRKFDFIETKWTDVVDSNRSLEYNNKLIVNFLEEERNKIILENEKKIKPIEKLETENLIVVVPDTMEDFTKEGCMQNNCIGFYYHDSISEGKNYIYFIRKKDNPEKSYITNRFSVEYNETMETLKINNRKNDDNEALELIQKIDKMIRKLI